MQRKFKISVDGRDYDVVVEEILDEGHNLYPEPQNAAAAVQAAAVAEIARSVSARHAAGPGDLVCPIAAIVVSIDVAVGAEVAVGTPVLSLEAMKTKTIVSADRAGTVTAIAVAVGDPVEPGQALLTIS